MVWQRSPGMNPSIHLEGCYFMSLLWHAALRQPDLAFDIPHINNIIYPTCVERGWMREDCYVEDPEAVLRYCGLNTHYLGKFPTDRVCGDSEFEVVLWHYAPEDWYHFVAGDGFGNTTYDPWGRSTTATHGQRKSKRIFRIL